MRVWEGKGGGKRDRGQARGAASTWVHTAPTYCHGMYAPLRPALPLPPPACRPPAPSPLCCLIARPHTCAECGERMFLWLNRLRCLLVALAIFSTSSMMMASANGKKAGRKKDT